MANRIFDGSGSGYSIRGTTLPHDWTEGTGVFPAGGVITVAAPDHGAMRKWLLIQNQGAAQITVSFQAQDAFGNTVTANMMLATGSGAGTQGAADERGGSFWNTCGTVIITGAAGSAVLVLEVTG